MARKRTTGRPRRHGTPEENLSSRESRVIKKGGAKKFVLAGIEKRTVNFNEQMNRVFQEIPAHGKRVKTDLSRTVLEDRE